MVSNEGIEWSGTGDALCPAQPAAALLRVRFLVPAPARTPDRQRVDAYKQLLLTSDIALVLRGDNLTDEEIFTRNRAGSIDLGTPRTFWAGLRIGL